MSEETDREEKRLQVLRWFRVRWALPVLNAVLIVAIVILIGDHNTEQQELANLQVSSAVNQAFDQAQINASAKQAREALAFDAILHQFFAEQNFICQELVAHNKVLGGPKPPPGICSVTLP